jgi:signal transduction histidine kinase
MQSDTSISPLRDVLLTFSAITERIAEHDENLEQLLHAILGLTVSMPNVSYASILLLDEKQSSFETKAARGDSPLTFDLKTVLQVPKLVRCREPTPGKRMLFEEVADDAKWHRLKPQEKRLAEKISCWPTMIENEITGIACVYDDTFDRGTPVSEAFTLWARFASLAIEKSRLYNQMHRRLEFTLQELERSQSQLIRSEKLNSLAEIALSVGHSIRNPVTVIGGLSRRLQRNIPEYDSKRLLSDMILSEASNLESIVREFERLFSIKEISFQYEDVNRLVEEAADDFIAQCQGGPQATLTRSLCNEPLNCRVDPDLLIRCFAHLLANALEAAPDGIHIILETSRTDKHAIIDVTDSGKGMSREEMDHVFDPFYSTKGHGTGMGLTFVHFVISEHSGQVEIRSEKNVGTRFRIRLPLASAS